MKDDYYLGIDVGGTDIKIGLVDEHGEVHFRHNEATKNLVSPERVFQFAVDHAQKSLSDNGLEKDQLCGIGVAVPGVLDTKEGALREVVNLPGWLGVSLRKRMAQASELPTTLINDANAAAYAEHVCRGLAEKSLALITLGTGIGCGLVLAGRPHGGDHGCAGELGHIAIDFTPEAVSCTCGSHGHLESYAGAPGVLATLRRHAEKLPSGGNRKTLLASDITPRDIARHAESGNETCIEVVRETAGYLGRAIGMLGQVCNPAVVVLGGAMTFGGESTVTGRMFLEAVRASVKRTTLVQVGGNMDIHFASLGNDAGISGAGLIARHSAS